MADETRTANVQLNADVSGYTQGLSEANEQTNLLLQSVNKLSTSMDGITKKIGKKLLLFSAADTAALTGYVLVASKYEKQLTTLRAQTELSNKSLDKYKTGISDLSKEIPKSRGELAQLVTQINQLGITSEREAVKLARVFSNLSAATGDDIGALTTGMIELGRAMGTLGGGAGAMENFSDSLTSVSNAAGVSAASVVSFANSISPFARSAGIGEAALLGISAAFTKAGADGYAAANTFNTIVADITRQIQNGSPEIAKYATAIGVTAEQFKKMDMSERITQIFEAVNKAGPGGIRIMDQLGQDGIRAARAIQQVSNQAGGLRESINIALEAYGTGTTQQGATAAFDSMDSKLTLLKNNMVVMGGAIGDALIPPLKAALDVINQMVSNASAFLDPLLKAAAMMGAVLAPFAAAAGTLSTLLGPLSTLMMGFMLFRLSPMRSLLSGLGEGNKIGTGQGATPAPAPGATPVSINQKVAAWRAEQAAALAANRLPDEKLRVPAHQLKMYQLGERLGSSVPGVAASRLVPSSALGLGTLTLKGVGALAEGTRQWAHDASLKNWWERRSIATSAENWMRERVPSTPPGYGLMDRVRATGGILSTAWGERGSQGQGFFKTLTSETDKYSKQVAQATAAQASNTTTTTGNTGSKAANTTANTTHTASLSQRVKAELQASASTTAFSAALRKAAYQTFIGYPASMARFGWNAGGQIIGGVGRGIGSLLGSIGGLVGGGSVTGGVLAATGLAAWYAKQKADKMNENALTSESLTNLGPTNVALGQATQQLKNFALSTKDTTRAIETMTDAAIVDASERASLAVRGTKDARINGMQSDLAIVAFLKSMGRMTPEQYHSLVLDITNAVGSARAQNITRQYSSGTSGGYSPYKTDFSAISGPLYDSASMSNSAGAVGFARSSGLAGFINPAAYLAAQFSLDAPTQEQVNAVWASIPQRSAEQEALFNPKAGGISQSSDVYRAISDAWKTGDKTIMMESIKNFEKTVLGKELNATDVAMTDQIEVAGQDVQASPEDFFKALWDPNNTSASGWREQQAALGLTAADFTGSGADLEAKKRKAQYEVLPETEKALRGTTLGVAALDSETIKKVTSGEEVATPTSTRTALNELEQTALDNVKAGESLTIAFQELKNNAGAASSYLYQLAAAAMSEAQSTQVYRAKSKGWTEEFTTRWTQVTDQMSDTLTNEDELPKLREERRAMTDDIRGRLQSIIQQERSYRIQRDRSQQDFDKSMRRSIENASSAWQSAYQRGANQQQLTSSPGLIQFNQEEQLVTAKGQLAGLKKLRGMGLSDQAIADLALADSANGNQTIRIAQTADKAWVEAQNQLAKERKAVVEELTREFSRPFQQAEEDFAIAADRAREDIVRVGEVATGTIAELSKKAAALAKSLGISDMAALTQVLKVVTGMETADTKAGLASRRRKGIQDSEDYWASKINYLTQNDKTLETSDGDGKTLTENAGTKFLWFGDKFPIPTPGAVWDAAKGTADIAQHKDEAFGPGAFTTVPNVNHPGMYDTKGYVPWTAGSVKSNATGFDSPTYYKGGDKTTTNYNNTTNYNLTGDIVAEDPDKLIGELRRRAAMRNLRTGASGQAINPATV